MPRGAKAEMIGALITGAAMPLFILALWALLSSPAAALEAGWSASDLVTDCRIRSSAASGIACRAYVGAQIDAIMREERERRRPRCLLLMRDESRESLTMKLVSWIASIAAQEIAGLPLSAQDAVDMAMKAVACPKS